MRKNIIKCYKMQSLLKYPCFVAWLLVLLRRHPPASASQGLGLQMCTTELGRLFLRLYDLSVKREERIGRNGGRERQRAREWIKIQCEFWKTSLRLCARMTRWLSSEGASTIKTWNQPPEPTWCKWGTSFYMIFSNLSIYTMTYMYLCTKTHTHTDKCH